MPGLLDLYKKAYAAYKSMEDSRTIAFTEKASKLKAILDKYEADPHFEESEMIDDIIKLQNDETLGKAGSKSKNILDILYFAITHCTSASQTLEEIEKLAKSYSVGWFSAWVMTQDYMIKYQEFVTAAKSYTLNIVHASFNELKERSQEEQKKQAQLSQELAKAKRELAQRKNAEEKPKKIDSPIKFANSQDNDLIDNLDLLLHRSVEELSGKNPILSQKTKPHGQRTFEESLANAYHTSRTPLLNPHKTHENIRFFRNSPPYRGRLGNNDWYEAGDDDHNFIVKRI